MHPPTTMMPPFTPSKNQYLGMLRVILDSNHDIHLVAPKTESFATEQRETTTKKKNPTGKKKTFKLERVLESRPHQQPKRPQKKKKHVRRFFFNPARLIRAWFLLVASIPPNRLQRNQTTDHQTSTKINNNTRLETNQPTEPPNSNQNKKNKKTNPQRHKNSKRTGQHDSSTAVWGMPATYSGVLYLYTHEVYTYFSRHASLSPLLPAPPCPRT